MMKFGHIISQVGLDPKKYPRSSEISVELYDRKNRVIGENDFNFNGQMFKDNSISKSKFIHMIDNCEDERKKLPDQISARINYDALVVFFPYKAPVFLLLS